VCISFFFSLFQSRQLLTLQSSKRCCCCSCWWCPCCSRKKSFMCVCVCVSHKYAFSIFQRQRQRQQPSSHRMRIFLYIFIGLAMSMSMWVSVLFSRFPNRFSSTSKALFPPPFPAPVVWPLRHATPAGNGVPAAFAFASWGAPPRHYHYHFHYNPVKVSFPVSRLSTVVSIKSNSNWFPLAPFSFGQVRTRWAESVSAASYFGI